MTRCDALGLLLVFSIAAPLEAAGRVLPRVPEGFEIEIAAESPLVERPVMACFDDRGRLYLVDSAGVNEPFEKLLENPAHRITILEDTDGDGRFDRRTLFADKLVMPQGVLPYHGAVYCASPPSVWKLEDTDNDGVCDRRTAIVGEFGSNGNAADIHGPFLGPDGWLYLCDGRHGHKVRRDDGSIDAGLAGGIFRFRLDGTGFERVCGGGFDNPVEIDFTDAGEILGTVNILHHNPRQDCLMHWIEGGVYPHADQEQCIAEYKKTGDLLTEVKALGHVAVAGMTRYRTGAFGADYRDNLFITLFNRHQVLRSIVERSGSTFASREEEFLVSDEKDFHPTDVFEDADGSLLVIDTGGWFRIGCPVSEIARPDVLGAIYRIRRRGMPKSRPDTNPASVIVAHDLAATAYGSLGELDETARIAAIRRLGRPDTMLPAPHFETILAEVAARVVGDTPAVRREAANTLGRLYAGRGAPRRGPAAAAVLTALMESIRAGVVDRVLEHSLIFALIRIDDARLTAPWLADPNPEVRRAALIALDQMDHGDLTREMVTPLLDTDDPALQKAALGVIAARKGWATDLVALLKSWLGERDPAEERLALARGILLAQSTDPAIQQLVAQTLADDASTAATRQMLWEVMQRASLDRLPAAWIESLGPTLSLPPTAEAIPAISIVRERGLAQFDGQLRDMADCVSAAPATRVMALAAAAPRLKDLSEDRFALLENHLSEETDPLLLLEAARGLAEAPLSNEQLERLAVAIPGSGALAVPVLLQAFTRSTDAIVGGRLIAALVRTPAAENLAVDELAALLSKYPSSVQKEAGPLLARLGGSSLTAQKQRLTELATVLDPPGDATRGKAVFLSRKAACSNCHQIAGAGGKVGPDLTKIAASRSGIDLLEAIVFPSATFARDFRPYVIATDAGRVFTGVITRQTPDAIHLRTADLAEVRIPRSAIEEMKESNTSIMPRGLDAALSAEELRDLLAYLRELK